MIYSKPGYRDSLTRRLIEIILQLQAGETLSRIELAEKYKCDVKTISKDMRVLADYFPILKTQTGRTVSYQKQTSETVKQCSFCKLFKSVDEFGKNKRYKDGLQKDGLQYECRSCLNKTFRERYSKSK